VGKNRVPELCGGMKEKDMGRIIIGDMQPLPAVFDALLHFIYTDSLPAMNDLDRNDYQYHETIWHLLVAADRYAMERLKIICESILCKNI
jgi:speckle-type POZ protein